MDVIHLDRPTLIEACPTASLTGFSIPSVNQTETLLSRNGDGRLNPSLRDDSIVRWGDAVGTLASACVFRLLERGAATAAAGFGGTDNPDLWRAIADLSVSGHDGLMDFRRRASRDGVVDIAQLRDAVVDAAADAATALSVSLASTGADAIRSAADDAVDRALDVVWALHGPAPHRTANRAALDWIAVNAERDLPARPVNVPATGWPTADVDVSVLHAGQRIETRIRYAIAGVEDASTVVDTRGGLPDTDTPPQIPEDAVVVVFLHGHSSRLEEGESFYQSIVARHAESCLRRPLVMISFDFPTNGYSQYIDHETISPLGATTRFVPDRPLERRFGMLEYYERVVVRFVDALNEKMLDAGHPGFLDRIGAVIGGSMGGNLALRLSERLVTFTPWLDALVAWSPASVYGSFGRADYFIPSPGEHVDPIAKEALERPFQRCQDSESDDSRRNFIGLQMQGERLINDGTPEFEAGVRLLTFFLQPLIGGLAPMILGPGLGTLVSGLLGPVVLGSVTVEGIANIYTIKQSDEWLREECRGGFDSSVSATGILFGLHEVYNSMRRRMHWRIAYEQLLFSHQDEVADSGGMPCYEASVVPTLLIAGADDVVDAGRFNIFGGVQTIAPRMINNAGLAILVQSTGHSIHAERPLWLADQIYRFICTRRPPREVIAVHREDGRIVALEFGGIWRPVPVEEAASAGGTTPYFIVDPVTGERTPIISRRYLTTRPDDSIDNNLRALPITTLPVPEHEVRGPVGGFEVTHVRVTSSGPAPWSSWISHFCNDSLGHQVSAHLAEQAVADGEARYFIRTDAGDNDLLLAQYLTTAPDDHLENNLSMLPDA